MTGLWWDDKEVIIENWHGGLAAVLVKGRWMLAGLWGSWDMEQLPPL